MLVCGLASQEAAARDLAADFLGCTGPLLLDELRSPPERLHDQALNVGLDADGERMVLWHAYREILLRERGRTRRIADLQTPLPGHQEPPRQFLEAWIDKGTIVFRADVGLRAFIYRFKDGQLELLVPNARHSFQNVGLPSILGDTVWFWGRGHASGSALYWYRDGSVGTLPKSKAGGLLFGGTPTPSGGRLTVSGKDARGKRGVVVIEKDLARMAVRDGAAVPDGTSLSNVGLGHPVMFGDGLLFVADAGATHPNLRRRGLWYSGKERVLAVVDPATTEVKGLGRFAMVSANGPFVDGDAIVFKAGLRLDGSSGIWIRKGCTVTRVVYKGDRLDGRLITNVPDLPRQAVRAGRIAFTVIFDDKTRATYMVRIP